MLNISKHLIDQTFNVHAKEALLCRHVTSHSDFFSTVPCTVFPASYYLLSLIKCQSRTARVSESCLTFTCLSLCVSFYLLSILNQEIVAWTWEGIILTVSVPTSGLCFPAWLWLWSWPSMPCRSARRRKKEVIHPQAYPKHRRCLFWD